MTYVPKAQPGEGTILAVKISSTFTEIALVTEIDGVGAEIAAIEKTHLTSTVHEYRPSKLPGPGKPSFKILLDPDDVATQALLQSRVNTPGTVDDFKLTFNTGDVTTPSTATFSGFVTKFMLTGVKVEENLEADIEIQQTTVVSYIAGAA